MRAESETVRNLEQCESGEIRRLECTRCGRRSFASREQLFRHELECIQHRAEAREG